MEPMPDTHAILSKNIRLNRSDVKALREATYDGSSPTVRLLRFSYHSGGDFTSPEGTIETPTCTLDDVWREHDPFDLIKVDVKGAEVKVLEGLSQISKYLVIEVRPRTWPYIKR